MQVADLERLVKPVCESEGIRSLQLFGSRAREDSESSSDFDFLVDLGDLPPADYARCYFQLLHKLEDVLNAPVDLLTVPSVQKESLRRELARDGVTLHG